MCREPKWTVDQSGPWTNHEIQGIAGFAGLLLTICVLLNNRVLSHGCAPPQVSRFSLILPLSPRFNASQVSLFYCEFIAFSSEIVYNHGVVHTYFFNNPTLSQVSTHLKFCRFVVDSLCFVRNHVLSRCCASLGCMILVTVTRFQAIPGSAALLLMIFNNPCFCI